METNRDYLLTTLLNCGSLDLKLLDDVEYDWCDIIDKTEGVRDINALMYEVFQMGYDGIQTKVNDRICELEAIETNERDLDEDEEQEKAELSELDATEDFESFHNYLDTHVYCVKHWDTYKKYMEDALDEFRDNTGFEIGGN
jgi:hypothetical protein